MARAFCVGARVDGLYDANTDDVWYPARVRSVTSSEADGEPRYELLYDDGEVELQLAPAYVRAHAAGNISVGTRVIARYTGGDELYAGRIAEVQDNGLYTIEYDDSEVETDVPLEYIHEPPEEARGDEETSLKGGGGSDDVGGDGLDSTPEADEPVLGLRQDADDGGIRSTEAAPVEPKVPASTSAEAQASSQPQGGAQAAVLPATAQAVVQYVESASTPAKRIAFEPPPPSTHSIPDTSSANPSTVATLESLELLCTRLDDASTAKSALSALVKQMRAFPQDTATLVHSRDGEMLLLDVLATHRSHAVVQCYAFVLLRRLCFLSVTSTRDLLANDRGEGVVSRIVRSMRAFSDDAILQAAACGALAVFTKEQAGLAALTDQRATSAVLSSLRAHRTYSVHTRQVHYYGTEVLLELCELGDRDTMWELCSDETPTDMSGDASPIELLLFLLRQALSFDDKKACCAVGSLIMCLTANNGAAASRVLRLNGLPELSTVMAKYATEPGIQKFAAAASKAIALCSIQKSGSHDHKQVPPSKKVRERAAEILMESGSLESLNQEVNRAKAGRGGTNAQRNVGSTANGAGMTSSSAGPGRKRKGNNPGRGVSPHSTNGGANDPLSFSKFASPIGRAPQYNTFNGPHLGASGSRDQLQQPQLHHHEQQRPRDSNLVILDARDDRQSLLFDTYGIPAASRPKHNHGGVKRTQLKTHIVSAENAWATRVSGQQLMRDDMLAGPFQQTTNYQSTSRSDRIPSPREAGATYSPSQQASTGRTMFEQAYSNYNSAMGHTDVARGGVSPTKPTKKKKSTATSSRNGGGASSTRTTALKVRIENEVQQSRSKALRSPFVSPLAPPKREHSKAKRSKLGAATPQKSRVHSGMFSPAGTDSMNAYATRLFQDDGSATPVNNSKASARSDADRHERGRLSFADKLHKMIDKAKSTLANSNVSALPLDASTPVASPKSTSRSDRPTAPSSKKRVQPQPPRQAVAEETALATEVQASAVKKSRDLSGSATSAKKSRAFGGEPATLKPATPTSGRQPATSKHASMHSKAESAAKTPKPATPKTTVPRPTEVSAPAPGNVADTSVVAPNSSTSASDAAVEDEADVQTDLVEPQEEKAIVVPEDETSPQTASTVTPSLQTIASTSEVEEREGTFGEDQTNDESEQTAERNGQEEDPSVHMKSALVDKSELVPSREPSVEVRETVNDTPNVSEAVLVDATGFEDMKYASDTIVALSTDPSTPGDNQLLELTAQASNADEDPSSQPVEVEPSDALSENEAPTEAASVEGDESQLTSPSSRHASEPPVSDDVSAVERPSTADSDDESEQEAAESAICAAHSTSRTATPMDDMYADDENEFEDEAPEAEEALVTSTGASDGNTTTGLSLDEPDHEVYGGGVEAAADVSDASVLENTKSGDQMYGDDDYDGFDEDKGDATDPGNHSQSMKEEMANDEADMPNMDADSGAALVDEHTAADPADHSQSMTEEVAHNEADVPNTDIDSVVALENVNATVDPADLSQVPAEEAAHDKATDVPNMDADSSVALVDEHTAADPADHSQHMKEEVASDETDVPNPHADAGVALEDEHATPSDDTATPIVESVIEDEASKISLDGSLPLADEQQPASPSSEDGGVSTPRVSALPASDSDALKPTTDGSDEGEATARLDPTLATNDGSHHIDTVDEPCVEDQRVAPDVQNPVKFPSNAGATFASVDASIIEDKSTSGSLTDRPASAAYGDDCFDEEDPEVSQAPIDTFLGLDAGDKPVPSTDEPLDQEEATLSALQPVDDDHILSTDEAATTREVVGAEMIAEGGTASLDASAYIDMSEKHGKDEIAHSVDGNLSDTSLATPGDVYIVNDRVDSSLLASRPATAAYGDDDFDEEDTGDSPTLSDTPRSQEEGSRPATANEAEISLAVVIDTDATENVEPGGPSETSNGRSDVSVALIDEANKHIVDPEHSDDAVFLPDCNPTADMGLPTSELAQAVVETVTSADVANSLDETVTAQSDPNHMEERTEDAYEDVDFEDEPAADEELQGMEKATGVFPREISNIEANADNIPVHSTHSDSDAIADGAEGETCEPIPGIVESDQPLDIDDAVRDGAAASAFNTLPDNRDMSDETASMPALESSSWVGANDGIDMGPSASAGTSEGIVEDESCEQATVMGPGRDDSVIEATEPTERDTDASTDDAVEDFGVSVEAEPSVDVAVVFHSDTDAVDIAADPQQEAVTLVTLVSVEQASAQEIMTDRTLTSTEVAEDATATASEELPVPTGAEEFIVSIDSETHMSLAQTTPTGPLDNSVDGDGTVVYVVSAKDTEPDEKPDEDEASISAVEPNETKGETEALIPLPSGGSDSIDSSVATNAVEGHCFVAGEGSSDEHSIPTQEDTSTSLELDSTPVEVAAVAAEVYFVMSEIGADGEHALDESVGETKRDAILATAGAHEPSPLPETEPSVDSSVAIDEEPHAAVDLSDTTEHDTRELDIEQADAAAANVLEPTEAKKESTAEPTKLVPSDAIELAVGEIDTSGTHTHQIAGGGEDVDDQYASDGFGDDDPVMQSPSLPDESDSPTIQATHSTGENALYDDFNEAEQFSDQSQEGMSIIPRSDLADKYGGDEDFETDTVDAAGDEGAAAENASEGGVDVPTAADNLTEATAAVPNESIVVEVAAVISDDDNRVQYSAPNLPFASADSDDAAVPPSSDSQAEKLYPAVDYHTDELSVAEIADENQQREESGQKLDDGDQVEIIDGSPAYEQTAKASDSSPMPPADNSDTELIPLSDVSTSAVDREEQSPEEYEDTTPTSTAAGAARDNEGETNSASNITGDNKEDPADFGDVMESTPAEDISLADAVGSDVLIAASDEIDGCNHVESALHNADPEEQLALQERATDLDVHATESKANRVDTDQEASESALARTEVSPSALIKPDDPVALDVLPTQEATEEQVEAVDGGTDLDMMASVSDQNGVPDQSGPPSNAGDELIGLTEPSEVDSQIATNDSSDGAEIDAEAKPESHERIEAGDRDTAVEATQDEMAETLESGEKSEMRIPPILDNAPEPIEVQQRERTDDGAAIAAEGVAEGIHPDELDCVDSDVQETKDNNDAEMEVPLDTTPFGEVAGSEATIPDTDAVQQDSVGDSANPDFALAIHHSVPLEETNVPASPPTDDNVDADTPPDATDSDVEPPKSDAFSTVPTENASILAQEEMKSAGSASELSINDNPTDAIVEAATDIVTEGEVQPEKQAVNEAENHPATSGGSSFAPPTGDRSPDEANGDGEDSNSVGDVAALSADVPVSDMPATKIDTAAVKQAQSEDSASIQNSVAAPRIDEDAYADDDSAFESEDATPGDAPNTGTSPHNCEAPELAAGSAYESDANDCDDDAASVSPQQPIEEPSVLEPMALDGPGDGETTVPPAPASPATEYDEFDNEGDEVVPAVEEAKEILDAPIPTARETESTGKPPPEVTEEYGDDGEYDEFEDDDESSPRQAPSQLTDSTPPSISSSKEVTPRDTDEPAPVRSTSKPEASQPEAAKHEEVGDDDEYAADDDYAAEEEFEEGDDTTAAVDSTVVSPAPADTEEANEDDNEYEAEYDEFDE